MATKLSSDDIKKIARLASLPVTDEEINLFSEQFTKTIKVVEQFNEVDTKKTGLTSQVTGLENITRPDTINRERMLTQDQVLSQAFKSHNGYFVVKGILNQS